MISIEKRAKRSQIPAKWSNAVLSDYKLDKDTGDPAALAAVAKWCESHSGVFQRWDYGMMLVGPPGPGKSMLACIAANSVLERGGQPYFLPVQELQTALLDRMGMEDRDEQDRFDHLLYYVTHGVDLLILDDMGSERASPTAYIEDRIKEIIRARGNAARAMFVTTNLTQEQFAVRYGVATASFLQEVCQIVKVNAPDYRRRLANVRK